MTRKKKRIKSKYLSPHRKPKGGWKFTATRGEKNPIYFGIELEINNSIIDLHDNDEKEEQLKLSYLSSKYFKDKFFITEDGSIENGFEIVLHPFTYKALKAINLNEYFSFLRFMGYNAAQSYSNCGLHINVSKKDINDKQFLFLKKFIIANESFIKSVSRRSKYSFDEFCQIPPSLEDCFWRRENRYYDFPVIAKREDRYEFRIFNGTLDITEFYNSIAFIEALVKYTKTNPKTTDLLDFFFYLTTNDHYRDVWLMVKSKFLKKSKRGRPTHKASYISLPGFDTEIRLLY